MFNVIVSGRAPASSAPGERAVALAARIRSSSRPIDDLIARAGGLSCSR